MKRKYEIIGAPFAFAANKNGSENAPKYLRKNGLDSKIKQRIKSWGEDISDYGDVELDGNIEQLIKDGKIIESVGVYCKKLKEVVENSRNNGKTPIIIGGDHSISIGTIAGIKENLVRDNLGKKLGVIWIDAHADINNFENGNIHGKSVAILLGEVYREVEEIKMFSNSINAEDLILIGINDIMPNEAELIREKAIKMYEIEKIDELGIEFVIKKAIEYMENNTDGFFVSFDIDSCDGGIYRGCATPEIGGFSAREALRMLKSFSESKFFLGVDFVEFSPVDDEHGNTCQLMNKLIDAVFGYRM